MNIYIYGSKEFKRSVNTILLKADIVQKIDNINTISRLKKLIKDTPDDIFIIDEEKIIYENFFTKTLKFLNPKDGIEKKFLNKYGVGDICFNSLDGVVSYIKSRTKEFDDLEFNGNEKIIKDNLEDEKIVTFKDPTEIKSIEEIEEFQMDEAILDLKNKKD